MFEEIKFEELQPHELHDDELHPIELQVHELTEDELDDDDLHVQELQPHEFQDHEKPEHELPVHELHEPESHELQESKLHDYDESPGDYELQVPEVVEYHHILEEEEYDAQENWPQNFEIITTTTKGHKDEEKEELEEYPEIQFSEFQVKVIDYDEDKPSEIGKPALVEELLTPRRPKLQQPGGAGRTLQKPVLQHWESRELLENTVEREFRLAREFVRARELPAIVSPRAETGPAEENPSESGKDLDLEELDLDMEGLQMESFIVFEYPVLEDEREGNHFNFDETFTSKSAKYSIYYH